MITFLQKNVDRIYKHFSRDLGFMLLVTGAVGWALSSLAHVTAVVINKDIPKEQKNFLIPQEIADAFVNIAAFIAITHQFNKLGTRLVENGKIISKPVYKFLQDTGLDKNIGKKNFVISKTNEFLQNKGIQKKFYEFYDGVDFTSSTIGAVISCNVVTPLLRNILGAKRQKALMTHDKPYQNPIMPLKPRTTIDNYAYNASRKITLTTPNSSLKI